MMKLTHAQLVKQLRLIAKEYGVRLWIVKKLPGIGFYDQNKRLIYLQKDLKGAELASVFFHELGHYVDHQEKKYANYYRNRTSFVKLRKLALKAEWHADYTGRRIAKNYLRFRFEPHYQTLSAKKDLIAKLTP